MKAPDLKKFLKLSYTTRQPLYIEGPPGIGKTDITREFSRDEDLELLACHLVYWDPVDLRGMPSIADGQTTWLTPSIFPTKGKGIMFLDELPQASVSVQAACFQLLRDRKLGEYTLPEGWSVVAAGNAQTHRAGANKILSPNVSRMMFATLDVDLQAWSEWAIKVQLHPMILAFIRFRIDLLHQFDPGKWDGKSYPCPRAWEMLGKALDYDDSISAEVMAGIVGEAAAIEFSAFRKLFQALPPLDSIIHSPNTAPIPAEPSAMIAVATGLARKATPGNIGKILTYADRLQREYSMLLVVDALACNRKNASTPEYSQWCVKNSDLLT